MDRLEQLKADLIRIDRNIAQGERFEANGYDCGMMLAMTRTIRAQVAREIKELEGENGADN